jgi:hypothetical protein
MILISTWISSIKFESLIVVLLLNTVFRRKKTIERMKQSTDAPRMIYMTFGVT